MIFLKKIFDECFQIYSYIFELKLKLRIIGPNSNHKNTFYGHNNKCFAQRPQHSDAGDARTRSPSVSSQALSH